MPIPLLFIAAGAGTALFGVGKGVKAGIDQKEASDTNKAYIISKVVRWNGATFSDFY